MLETSEASHLSYGSIMAPLVHPTLTQSVAHSESATRDAINLLPGQHSREILAELGYTEDEYKKLVKAKVIRGDTPTLYKL